MAQPALAGMQVLSRTRAEVQVNVGTPDFPFKMELHFQQQAGKASATFRCELSHGRVTKGRLVEL
jgi:hypothetical protein